jgi:hypothetical protein
MAEKKFPRKQKVELSQIVEEEQHMGSCLSPEKEDQSKA